MDLIPRREDTQRGGNRDLLTSAILIARGETAWDAGPGLNL